MVVEREGRTDEVGMSHPGARVASSVERRSFLKWSALGVAAVAGSSTLLAACTTENGTQGGTSNGKPPAAPTGSASIALAGAPPSLDPTTSFSANDLPVTCNIYDSLLRYDGELRPALATRHSVNADATVWTFELRRGVKFHDGSDFDASAVKATIDYHARTGSAVSFLVGTPASIDVSNPSKIVVKFDDPFPEFARYMTVVKIISPKLLTGSDSEVAERVNSSPTGTGPYRFVRRQGNDVVVTAFEDYWDEGPYIKDFTFRVVPDESTRVSALQAGDLSIVTRVPPPTAQGLEGDAGIALLSAPTLTVVQLSLTSARPPFNDVRVRQALMYAIDRQAILDSLYKGKGTVTGSPLPPLAYGFAKPATQYGHDPEKAKGLLAEAGYTDPLPFSMNTFNSIMLGSSLGQAIAEMASEAGFDPSFEVVDQGVGDKDLVKGNDRKYDVTILENGYVAGSALHVNNVTFYSQYEGKDLLDQIASMNSMADGAERQNAMAAMQETWAKELPCLPMWSIDFIDALESTITDFEPPIDGYQPRLAPAYRTAAS